MYQVSFPNSNILKSYHISSDSFLFLSPLKKNITKNIKIENNTAQHDMTKIQHKCTYSQSSKNGEQEHS